jgi:general secretion pathway protein G
MKTRRFLAGFTMIELLVVATIMIVLTTIGLVSYRNAAQNSRNAKRKTDLQTTRQALVLYRSDNGCYPSDATFLGMLSTITDYISETPYDPQGSAGDPLYTYEPVGAGDCGTGEATGFTLGTTLEPDDTAYTVGNP